MSNLELTRTSLEKLLNICEMGNQASKVGHTITHNLQFDSEHPEIQRILATASAAFERYEEAEDYSLNRKKKRHQERDLKKGQRENASQAAQVDPYDGQRIHGHCRRGNRRAGRDRLNYDLRTAGAARQDPEAYGQAYLPRQHSFAPQSHWAGATHQGAFATPPYSDHALSETGFPSARRQNRNAKQRAPFPEDFGEPPPPFGSRLRARRPRPQDQQRSDRRPPRQDDFETNGGFGDGSSKGGASSVGEDLNGEGRGPTDGPRRSPRGGPTVD